jgi:uncharacterized protein
MTIATARRIVDFVIDASPFGRRIEFSFFGGEPLLRFDLIKQIANYIHMKEQEMGKRASLSVTTNGTLVSQPMLDFFRTENVELCISIDGPAHVHDLNRCYKSGRGSFTRVVRNLRMAMDCLDGVQVNAVYGPETIDLLPQSVSFLTELGVPVIHLNPDILAKWADNIYPKLLEIYMQIADYYIQSYQCGREIALNLIDSKLILLMKGGYATEDMCGMGETEWGFAPSGNIYPCERFIGEDDDLSLCLGNIHTGLDLTHRCPLLRRRENPNQECKSCNLMRYCMNWCGCTNYYLTGNTEMAGPVLCSMEKSAIKAAEHVLVTLSKFDNELFVDHLMRYLYEGRHYRRLTDKEG